MHHANFTVQCLVSYPQRDRVGAIGFEYHIHYCPQPGSAEPKPPVIRLMRPGLQPKTGNVMSELGQSVLGFVVSGFWMLLHGVIVLHGVVSLIFPQAPALT